MAELALALPALLLWGALDDGPLREAAYMVGFVAALSTLVLNANPLQRLDGYYILCDLLDLPNLGPRSRRWWTQTLSRRLLRLLLELLLLGIVRHRRPSARSILLRLHQGLQGPLLPLVVGLATDAQLVRCFGRRDLAALHLHDQRRPAPRLQLLRTR